MRCLIFALTFEYSLGFASKGAVGPHGPPTVVQHAALVRLGSAAEAYMDMNPGQIKERWWTCELAKKELSFTGEEVCAAQVLTFAQASQSLPPAGVAASLSALGLAEARSSTRFYIQKNTDSTTTMWNQTGRHRRYTPQKMSFTR